MDPGVAGTFFQKLLHALTVRLLVGLVEMLKGHGHVHALAGRQEGASVCAGRFGGRVRCLWTSPQEPVCKLFTRMCKCYNCMVKGKHLGS